MWGFSKSMYSILFPAAKALWISRLLIPGEQKINHDKDKVIIIKV